MAPVQLMNKYNKEDFTVKNCNYIQRVLDTQSSQTGIEMPMTCLEDLEREYKKLFKKRKKGKIGKKKFGKKLKKLKKELEKAEIAIGAHTYAPSKTVSIGREWWQDIAVETVPKIIDRLMAGDHRK